MVRGVALGHTMVVVLLATLLLDAPAGAATTEKVSRLNFPSSDPAAASLGPSASLKGDVRPHTPDHVDFWGRGVVRLPDRRSFDPGHGDFAVGVKFRLTRGAGNWNLAQKGLWNDPAQWKVSLHKDSKGLRLSCRFKGERGAVHAYSKYGVVKGTGWTRARCKLKAETVLVKVGSKVVGKARGSIGRVASNAPVRVGSKGLNAKDPDQFLGLVDRFWIRS